jgi:hypothetical protein
MHGYITDIHLLFEQNQKNTATSPVQGFREQIIQKIVLSRSKFSMDLE